MLTIYLPHLDWPYPKEVPPLNTPALNQILRFGRKRQHHITHAEFCFSALNITLPAAHAYAAPIFHQAGMHSVHISGAHHLGITETEAQQFCQLLNDLYAQDGWHFTPHTPHWWCVDLPKSPDWQTPCVLDILGVADGMARPIGADGRDWLQKHTEIQMAMHAHPLNEARRESGQMPINGVWLWHGLPERAAHLSNAVVKMLASDCIYAPSSCLTLPENWQNWCETVRQYDASLDESALYFNALSDTVESGDVQAYGWHLQQIDALFLLPIYEAVQRGQISGLVLHTQSGTVVLKKQAWWSFWRRKFVFRGQLFC